MRHALLLLGMFACGSIASDEAMDDPLAPVTTEPGGSIAASPEDIKPPATPPSPPLKPPVPPAPTGCVTTVGAGEKIYQCAGLAVHASVPPRCLVPGCGLILQLHGDSGNGDLMDKHTGLRALGVKHGYIVLSPTGPLLGMGYPGGTWTPAEDAKLVEITNTFAEAYHVASRKIHVTGFSRGGWTTWRLLCDYPWLFGSAAPGGAGDGRAPYNQTTCFANGRAPSRKVDMLVLVGRTDTAITSESAYAILSAAVANYGAQANHQVLVNDATYRRDRWTSGQGHVIEILDHAFELDPLGPFPTYRGHCIPGSTLSTTAPQYAFGCKGPTAFNWGAEVMKFFETHPKRSILTGKVPAQAVLATGITPAVPQARAETIANQAAKAILGRDATAQERTQLAGMIAQGNLAVAINTLLASTAFNQRRLQLTETAWTEELYKQILGRASDEPGADLTAELIARGTAAPRIVDMFRSPEYAKTYGAGLQ